MDFNEIKEKEARLENARAQLKREFFGIDQIKSTSPLTS